MKNIFNFLLVVMFFVKFYSPALSQVQSAGANILQGQEEVNIVNPLYQLNVKNIQLVDQSPLGANTIFFDIYIYHTNLAQSGPFEFAAGQYYFNFNPEIANGGTLTYTIIPNSTEFTNPDAVPINSSVVGNQLRLSRNDTLGAGNGPIVSSIFPGTRVVSMKLQTSAPTFANRNLNLAWRDTTYGNPFTKAFAYIGAVMTDITGDGTLAIDTTNVFLPVELSSFTSLIKRNNVTLNWSTVTETNNTGFEIERSLNNVQWTKIGFTEGNGTSSSQNNYFFEDINLNSGSYKYRLKQIDFNGNYEYYSLQNEVVIGIPNEYSLKQNYPNPFNPVTKIDFDIPDEGFVSLKIFDINGRELKTLVNEFKNSGYHSVNLDASALPSGNYFYRLVSGNFTFTRKLVVLK